MIGMSSNSKSMCHRVRKIEVKSEWGQGTTFTVLLPVDKGERGAP